MYWNPQNAGGTLCILIVIEYVKSSIHMHNFCKFMDVKNFWNCAMNWVCSTLSYTALLLQLQKVFFIKRGIFIHLQKRAECKKTSVAIFKLWSLQTFQMKIYSTVGDSSEHFQKEQS